MGYGFDWVNRCEWTGSVRGFGSLRSVHVCALDFPYIFPGYFQHTVKRSQIGGHKPGTASCSYSPVHASDFD